MLPASTSVEKKNLRRQVWCFMVWYPMKDWWKRPPYREQRATVVYDPRDPHSINNNRIDTIYEDRQIELWFGKAWIRFDPETGCAPHVFNPAIDSDLKAENSIYFLKTRDRCGTVPEMVIIRTTSSKEYHFLLSPPIPWWSNSLGRCNAYLWRQVKSGLQAFGGTFEQTFRKQERLTLS